MSEFKYACPVCGQHIKCDSSQAGSVMDCPTCFQKITVPQAPASDDQKFILTGSQVTEKKITAHGWATASARRDSDDNILITVVFIVALVLAGAAAFAFRGKLWHRGPAWQASDIGEAGAAGSFSQANGVLTLNGSGADVWRRADAFQYVFQALNGDGAATAHVLNVQNTDVWAKGGVMIRETTNASSKFAAACIRPDGQAQFIWRDTTGGEAASSALAGGMGFPKWVMIKRDGSSFGAYYKVKAEDEWQPIGPSHTIGMDSSTQIGLIVCAHHAGILCAAVFDQVTLETNKKSGPGTNGFLPP
jgi:DNA-directed RNA polymerase subunit RPC12/RpoP